MAGAEGKAPVFQSTATFFPKCIQPIKRNFQKSPRPISGLKKKISTWKAHLQLTLIGSRWIPEMLQSVTAELKPTDTKQVN